jgi:hypothetical protein
MKMDSTGKIAILGAAISAIATILAALIGGVLPHILDASTARTATLSATNTVQVQTTPTSTDTPESPGTLNATNTLSPSPTVQREYPCDAVVDPYATTAILNEVKKGPGSSYATAENTLVHRGDTVTVLARSTEDGVYYRIRLGEETLGWISEMHLVLGVECP